MTLDEIREKIMIYNGGTFSETDRLHWAQTLLVPELPDGYTIGMKDGKLVLYPPGPWQEPLHLFREASDMTGIKPHDAVNHPGHYNQGGIECIDAIQAALSPAEFIGFLRGQVIKYQWRLGLKGAPAEDAAKANWYGHRLEEYLKGDKK